MEAVIEIVPDTQNEALRGKIVSKLHAFLADKVPAGDTLLRRSDRNTQGEFDELAVLAMTHISVIGLIEGVKVMWDLFHTPLRIKLPNGRRIEFRGDALALKELLHLLPGEHNDASPSHP